MPTSHAAIALVLGEEELLVSRAIEQIALAAIHADPDADVREFLASELEAPALYEALSPSLFGGRRVVVVRSAQDLKAAVVQALTPLLQAPADDVTVVLQHAGGAKGKALVEVVRKAGADVVNCAKLTKPNERIEFVRSEVKRGGGAITTDAARLLVEAVGSDLRELASAAGQLAADSGGRIDVDVVARYHQGRAEVKGFEVSDKAVVGDAAGALESLRWALADAVPQVVLADALAGGVEAVAKVASYSYADDRNANQYELAQRLGMPPWKVTRTQSQARGWSEAGLRVALRVVAELNADVKGNAVDPDYALERAVRAIAAAKSCR